jgi:hypothetical protein
MKSVYWMYLLFYVVGSFFGVNKVLGMVKGRSTAG